MKTEYRPFKKGDLVKIVEHKGRSPKSSKYPLVISSRWKDIVYEVTEDEDEYTCTVKLREYNTEYTNNPGFNETFHFSFLKLITRADERVPYEVIDSPNTYNIVDHRRNGNGCIITLHKLEPANTRELADKLCADLNGTTGNNLLKPSDIVIPSYELRLNSDSNGWELYHNTTGKVHAVVFFGNDGYKIPKDTAKTIITAVKDKLEHEWCPSNKSCNPPCADCKFWSEIYAHGSSSFGECRRGRNGRSCGYSGPFDTCPEYECKNN